MFIPNLGQNYENYMIYKTVYFLFFISCKKFVCIVSL